MHICLLVYRPELPVNRVIMLPMPLVWVSMSSSQSWPRVLHCCLHLRLRPPGW